MPLRCTFRMRATCVSAIRFIKGSSCEGGVGILLEMSPSLKPVMRARLCFAIRVSGDKDLSSAMVPAFVQEMCIATLNIMSRTMVAKGHSR